MTVSLLDLDEFEKYCSDVEHTAAWGGQLEVSSLRAGGGGPRRLSLCQLSRDPVFPVFLFQLRALTQVLQLPIQVVQASSDAIKIGEEFKSEPITLVYVITSILTMLLNDIYVKNTRPSPPVPAGTCVTPMGSESITTPWSG